MRSTSIVKALSLALAFVVVSNLDRAFGELRGVGCDSLTPALDARPTLWDGSCVVQPDGRGNYPTIQQAIDAGCTDIVLTPGVFGAQGDCDIDTRGGDVRIRSRDGDAATAIIDCGGAHQGFFFHSGESSATTVEKITIQHCSASRGGAIQCVNNSGPTITGCVIRGNSATLDGGGIYCSGASPAIQSCVISGNFAGAHGGAIYTDVDGLAIGDCTIAGNRATQEGGGIYQGVGDLGLDHCIVWGNLAEQGSYDGWYASGFAQSCCGDIELPMPQEASTLRPPCATGHVNIHGDPRFVDPRPAAGAPTAAGCYVIQPWSPCAPVAQPVCGLVGALGVGYQCPPLPPPPPPWSPYPGQPWPPMTDTPMPTPAQTQSHR